MQRFYPLLLVIVIGCAGTPKSSEEVSGVEKNRIEDPQKNVVVNSSDISARFVKAKLLFDSGRLKESFEEFLLLLEQDTDNSLVRKIGSTTGMLFPLRQIRNSNSNEANPNYDPSGEKIVFQSNRNNNYDLFLMNRTGGDVSQLTVSLLDDGFPIFSNETTIYFTRQQSANSKQRDIYAYNTETQTVKSIIVHPADDWYLAPTKNSEILFFVSDREIDGNNSSKIFRIDQNSRQISPMLVSQLHFSSPSVHPQKEEFLFTVKDDTLYSLYQCNFNGKEIRKLTTRNINFGGPKFSPDGKKIVFHSKISDNVDIYELNFQTDELIRLTVHPGKDLSPNYSPDGKKIVFYSDRTEKYQIFEINLELPSSRTQLLNRLRLAVREN